METSSSTPDGGDGEKIYTNTPIGTVLSFAGLTPPNGYLLCDGGSYVVADYQDLYDVIGNTYGGDSANFNVPNLIDKFIQGSDIIGIEKQAGLPNITGEATFRPISDASSVMTNLNTGVFSESNQYYKNMDLSFYSADTGGKYNAVGVLDFNAHLSNPIYGNSDTVQPPALTMAYIIKAFHTNEGVDSSVELEDNVINHIDNSIVNKINDFTEQVGEQVTEQISEGMSQLIIVSKEYPTTETCPVGSWYAMYIE